MDNLLMKALEFVVNHWIIIFAVLAIIGLVLSFEDNKLIDLKDIKGILKK
jgi:hypothetical protein